jgi:hypothetical protein
VQNLLRRKAMVAATEATGMHIHIGRLDLRFPLNLLVSDVHVVQNTDTLFNMQRLDVRVQLLPLFHGQVEIDNITIEQTSVHTASLLPGMSLDGHIGTFKLRSHGIDLTKNNVILNEIALDDSRLSVRMTDSIVAETDTTTTAAAWKVNLQTLRLRRVSLAMQKDTLSVESHIGEADIHNAFADLQTGYYSLERLLLRNGSLAMDNGNAPAAAGLDPAHIALSDMSLDIDSVAYGKHLLQALIRKGGLSERSGLQVTTIAGVLRADSAAIRLPQFHIGTSNSHIRLTGHMDWTIAEGREDGSFAVNLETEIGRTDAFVMARTLPQNVLSQYPNEPFDLQISLSGTPQSLQLRQLRAELPTSFSITGTGTLAHPFDSLRREGGIGLSAHTNDLGFLSAYISADSSIVLPPDMTMNIGIGVKGQRYTAAITAAESDARINLNGEADASAQTYTARLEVDSLNVRHFMPRDSIGLLAMTGTAEGRGFDFFAPQTTADAALTLEHAEYGKYAVSNLNLVATLRKAVASLQLRSDNPLLKGDVQATYALNTPYTEAEINADIRDVNLYELGLAPAPMPHPILCTLTARTMRDSVRIQLTAGDLTASYRSRGSLETVMSDAETFGELLQRQWDARFFDHAELRRALPSAALMVRAGQSNPLYDYLQLTSGIRYKNIAVGFALSPQRGINGRAALTEVRVDTLLLDTIYFATVQDTTKLTLRGGVINNLRNPHIAFHSTLTGEIRNNDAEMTLNFVNEQGKTGLLLGVNVRPESDGMLLSLTPERPIVAFDTLRLREHNRIFWRPKHPFEVDIEMLNDIGKGFTAHSLPDSTFNNVNFEVRLIDLADVSRLFPYVPDFAGLLSLDANYQETADGMQISAEATANKFTYTGMPIGDIGIGATWIPTRNAQFIDTYLTADEMQIMSANGSYDIGQDALDITTTLEHFPLRYANVFVPQEMAQLTGDMDGEVIIGGSTAKPHLSGSLLMDSVHILSPNYGVRFRLDDRPVHITDNRLVFDKFSVYSLVDEKNPFTVDGYIDMTELSNAHANLTLTARNYPLMNVSRDKAGQVYGQAYVNLNSTLRGSLTELVMRGNLNILPNTNVTYIMQDTPISVQDRLGDLVEFVSFSDTLRRTPPPSTLTSWGGLDMLLNISIDPAVRMGADLSPDRSSYVRLEGGGSLSFRYTPEGDMSLTGRYEFNGGTIRYALPVIPLKTFSIKEGSYVEWTGNLMNPTLNLEASEQMRASVPADVGSQMVNFDVGVLIRNRLQSPDLSFTLASPENRDIQDELDAMDSAERGKQAIALMVTGIYLARGMKSGESFDMGDALNSLLQSSLAGIAGSALKSVNITFGMDNYEDQTGTSRTDYNFRYSQRLFNNRVQLVIGGRVSTSDNNLNRSESFIDNVSLEYRLDNSNTRYLRLFHNKNYESVLEGEITETGLGLVLRKKVSRLSELFIFRRKKATEMQ